MTKSQLTPRELEALKILWKTNPLSVREIREAMVQAEDDLPYTTVLSLLQQMHRKQLVGNKKAGKAHVYFPRVRRDAAFRNLAGDFVERVFDGAMDEFVLRAIESCKPNLNELDQLEQAITAAREKLAKTHKKESK